MFIKLHTFPSPQNLLNFCFHYHNNSHPEIVGNPREAEESFGVFCPMVTVLWSLSVVFWNIFLDSQHYRWPHMALSTSGSWFWGFPLLKFIGIFCCLASQHPNMRNTRAAQSPHSKQGKATIKRLKLWLYQPSLPTPHTQNTKHWSKMTRRVLRYLECEMRKQMASDQLFFIIKSLTRRIKQGAHNKPNG